MVKLNIVELLDQRKPLSHILFMVISLVTVLLFSFKSGLLDSLSNSISFFLIVIIQIEVFIFIASRIFKEISVGLSPKEFTRIILIRFVRFIIICFIAAFFIFLTFRYLIAVLEQKDLSLVWENIMEYEIANWVKSTFKGLSLGAVIFVITQWQDALIRDEDKIELVISVPGKEMYLIMPVSLQILIENAINHNIATRDNPLKVSICIENTYCRK